MIDKSGKMRYNKNSNMLVITISTAENVGGDAFLRTITKEEVLS